MVALVCPLYLFRSEGFAPSGESVIAVAPIDHVAAVYGAGGAFEAGGLEDAFGGAAIFKCDETGEVYAGVWGARNAARFRSELRAKRQLHIIEEPPRARLVARSKKGVRP